MRAADVIAGLLILGTCSYVIYLSFLLVHAAFALGVVR